jgi:hypothetical protein
MVFVAGNYRNLPGMRALVFPFEASQIIIRYNGDRLDELTFLLACQDLSHLFGGIHERRTIAVVFKH